MEELTCFLCNCHVGWMYLSGPYGLILCDECMEEEEEEG